MTSLIQQREVRFLVLGSWIICEGLCLNTAAELQDKGIATSIPSLFCCVLQGERQTYANRCVLSLLLYPSRFWGIGYFFTQNQILKHQQIAASRSVGAQMATTNTLMLFLNVLTTESLKGMESDMK